MKTLFAAAIGLAVVPAAVAVAPPAPLEPVPSNRQLAWQNLGACAFVHFGPNTFTGREWGEGREEPQIFAPTQLDCRQWARAVKAGGLKGIIITAKHHDGFCLWPSKYSTHTVAQSAWGDGKRDVLRELSDACREEGLLFGVYLSPWDRNHPAYGTPEYNDVFKKMLEEVLTQYGPVFEVWFDGANGEGPNGKRQEYDWPGFIDTVRRLQPDACIFSDAGPDVRWVGNESGWAGETNWAPLRRDLFQPGSGPSAQLPYGHEDGAWWVPAECDVSIRPGWFYHPEQDTKVKSGRELLELYYSSVGRNANLLLNIPPDRRGLIAEPDQQALKDFRRAVEATFRKDLALNRPATASNTRGNDAAFAAGNVTDGRPDTYWATDDGVTAADLTIDLGGRRTLNRVLLQEHIPLGQRVKAFKVEAWDGEAWKTITERTTIGARRILRFEAVTTAKLRVRITDSRACPTLSTVSAYCAPPEVTITTDADVFTGETKVTLTTDIPGAKVRYTLDGRKPGIESSVYRKTLTLKRSAIVTAVAEFQGETSLWPAVRAFHKLEDRDFRPADSPQSTRPGLAYDYFEQALQSLDDLKGVPPTLSGETTAFDVGVARRRERFALRFTGFVEVPRDGLYTFELSSDDGGRLWIGDRLVIDNDGLHGMTPKSARVTLKKGKHAISVACFNATGDAGLSVALEGPGMPKRPIDSSLLSH
jgi:alpha-L-fucosidase